MAGEAPTKVLKYGLVQDGKIIEEGILSEKEGISLGSDPSNTISVPEANIPRKHRLIEPYHGGYRLTFFRGMEGKISIENKVFSLDDMTSGGRAIQKGSFYEIFLGPMSKGKLLIGKTTILFQLVPPPPPPPILKLPKDLRANMWSGFDLFFITIVLLSALFHISMVTYLNTLESTDALTSAETAKFAKRLVSTEDVEIIENEFKDEDLQEKKATKSGSGGKPGSSKGDEDKGVESKGLIALITKHGGMGGSVSDILSEGLGDDLTAAISGISGVDVARGPGGGLRETKGDGGSGSGGSVGVGDLASYSSKTSVKSSSRVETKVKSKISGASGGVSGAIDQNSVYSVIRRRIGGVRYCYESQLKTNPSLAGKIRVQFVIGASGSVSSCSVVSNSMGNTFVQECVCRMVRRWKFPTPDDGTVTVGYTFIFSSAG